MAKKKLITTKVFGNLIIKTVMKELSIEEKAKAYDKALRVIKECSPDENGFITIYSQEIFPELKESEDEQSKKWILEYLYDGLRKSNEQFKGQFNAAIAWLEKQGEQKEINLVDILKHYPRETELFSPLYGKLWLVEVDEKNEIITCYKHHLKEGCTRAVLEQEDTVSFYSNGTTGLPDFSVSKDCMLFLYDIEKQGEQKPAWSEEDASNLEFVIRQLRIITDEKHFAPVIDWLKSLRDRVQPKQDWSEEDEYNQAWLIEHLYGIEDSDKEYEMKCRKMANWLKSLKERYTWKPSNEQIEILDMVLSNESMDDNIARILRELREQLKKLKG